MLVARFLHVLGFTVWIGGMFFAYMALRPVAATLLPPPQRLTLWAQVLRHFFAWVWLSVALILASGLAMMALIGKPPLHILLMFVIGIAMMAIFAHVFFAPYRHLCSAVDSQDWGAAGTALGQVRKLVGLNLILGFVTITVATLGAKLA